MESTQKEQPIIVIGSGLGGLVAAAVLSRAGQKVLVFEQHSRQGGYATSFPRKKWEFEASLHMIGDLAQGGKLREVFEELGIWESLQFCRSKHLYRVALPGQTFEIPEDSDTAYLEDLSRLFPDQKMELVQFFERVHVIRDEMVRMNDASHSGQTPDMLETAPNLARYVDRTLGNVFDELGFPTALRCLLSQLWLYHGLPPSRLSFAQFAYVWNEYHRFGGWYPRGKSQSLSDALRGIILQNGGEVLVRKRVRAIHIDDGQAKGIDLADGQTIPCATIISNADPFQTFLELVGKDKLPSRMVRRLEELEPSCSSIQAFIVLDCRMSHAFGEQAHEIFVNETPDIEEAYRDSMGGNWNRAPFILTIYDNIAGEFQADKDSTTLSMFLLADPSKWIGITSETYAARKAEAKRILMARLNAMYPGITGHILHFELSTPRTNLRYTKNIGGAIYGLAPTVKQSLFRRLPHKTPFAGLWLVGAWTQPSGGYSGSLWSGYNLARRLLNSI